MRSLYNLYHIDNEKHITERITLRRFEEPEIQQIPEKTGMDSLNLKKCEKKLDKNNSL